MAEALPRIELLAEGPGSAGGSPDAGREAETDFLQSPFWGSFKAAWGWRNLLFRVRLTRDGVSREFRLLVLVRRLAGPLSFAYVPHGPAVTYPGPGEGAALLAALGGELRRALPAGCLLIRFDPPWSLEETENGGAQRPPVGPPLRRAAADVQPPDTVILDLGRSGEELLAEMKPKWRYNIRLAEKKGVTVAEEGPGSLPLFYALYEETARRDRIALHPQSYYERLFSDAAARSAAGAPDERPDLRLWVARHEGRALAAIITLFLGRRATYLYGASSDEGRNLMPAYALQWAAIRAAAEAGCLEYDFYGIPPTADEGHPMAGLYRFKTGFGGRILHYAGSWDFALMPLAYKAFRAAEAARSWWYKVALKRLGGR